MNNQSTNQPINQAASLQSDSSHSVRSSRSDLTDFKSVSVKSTNFVDIDNSRVEEQRIEMEKIMAEGHCPFCPENLKLYHKIPDEFNGQYWIITKNQWPYKNTLFHYLAILKRHAEMVSELTSEEGGELITLLGQLEKKLGVTGGGFAMRFGDTNLSAGTVKHLHAQFIVPDIDAAGYEPVRFKIGKDKGKIQSY